MGSPASPTDSPAPEPQRPRHGRVHLICGCMFSGKTTTLLRRLADWKPETTRVFKHAIDGRYNRDAIVSHAGGSWPAVAVHNADAVIAACDSDTRQVAIDEAHFFGMELVAAVRALQSRGVDVTLAALDRDSWGRPFPAIERLLAIADAPIFRHTACAQCGRSADHTQRLTPIVDGHMVGGPESYEPRCEECWQPPPEPPPV